jgi:peptide-methionine (S)-S-oxide reductase
MKHCRKLSFNPEFGSKIYSMKSDNQETATLAGGCFWCTETFFKRLKGIISVVPGYAGGTTNNPSYQDVVGGETGHAEAIEIKFNPAIISFAEILQVFWNTHDPTTENRQGNDVGTQYRSVIFYHDDIQKETAEKSRAALVMDKIYPDPVVTEIIPFTNFFPAENYHRDYFINNINTPYCMFVIKPKLLKFVKQFDAKLKPDAETF